MLNKISLITILAICGVTQHIALGQSCWYHDYRLLSSSSDTICDPKNTSDGEIGSCENVNDEPGEVTCQAQGGQEDVTTWQVTGSITPDMLRAIGLNITGSVGKTSKKTFSISSTAKIDAFCKECHAESGFQYQVTHYVLECCYCYYQECGDYEVYDHAYSKANTSSKPAPPCNPVCPSDG
jgi:hypothetical protein